jgi:hypothetical protein
MNLLPISIRPELAFDKCIITALLRVEVGSYSAQLGGWVGRPWHVLYTKPTLFYGHAQSEFGIDLFGKLDLWVGGLFGSAYNRKAMY